MKIGLFKGLLPAALLALSASAHATPPTPAMLANACGGCHGTNGASAGPSMPSLAGQTRESILGNMKRFKSGQRPSTIMGRIAQGYSETDFEAMADFFSQQKHHAATQTLDAAKVARGRSIEEDKCGRCHEDSGRIGKKGTPILAGQWLTYLQMQMALYESGKRGMPEKMAEKIKALSHEDLDALMHFYASVK